MKSAVDRRWARKGQPEPPNQHLHSSYRADTSADPPFTALWNPHINLRRVTQFHWDEGYIFPLQCDQTAIPGVPQYTAVQVQAGPRTDPALELLTHLFFCTSVKAAAGLPRFSTTKSVLSPCQKRTGGAKPPLSWKAIAVWLKDQIKNGDTNWSETNLWKFQGKSGANCSFERQGPALISWSGLCEI